MIRSINKSRSDYKLVISGLTWKKNYHNLFDYQQPNVSNFLHFNEQISTKQELFFLIFRNKKTFELQIQLKNKLSVVKIQDSNRQLLCGGKTILENKIYSIKFYQPDEILDQKLSDKHDFYLQHYIVVRSIRNKLKQQSGYKINERSLIKLGNCELFVHRIHFNNENSKPLHTSHISQTLQKINLQSPSYIVSTNQRIYNANQQKHQDDVECKYCLMPQNQNYGDFLCAPCKCAGSCGLVHFNCLVKWNHNKVKKTKSLGCTQYNFQKFFCQVCKEQYPQFIQKNTSVYQLLPIEQPKDDYMILQAFFSQKRHVIVMENIKPQGLNIGRSNQCQLKIDDHSISRKHANIKKIDQEYFIFDLKSKYGTLIRQSKLTVPLRQDDKFSIQAGKSMLTFALMPKNNDFLCVS